MNTDIVGKTVTITEEEIIFFEEEFKFFEEEFPNAKFTIAIDREHTYI
jgi:hypothetical protein